MSVPQSITFQVDPQTSQWLVLARVEDGVPAAERIRAALRLWHDDPDLRGRVHAAARRLSPLSQRPAARGDQPVKITAGVGELGRALHAARGEDGLPMTARIRALLQLWHDDPAVRSHIDDLAQQMRAQRRDSHLIAVPPGQQRLTVTLVLDTEVWREFTAATNGDGLPPDRRVAALVRAWHDEESVRVAAARRASTAAAAS